MEAGYGYMADPAWVGRHSSSRHSMGCKPGVNIRHRPGPGNFDGVDVPERIRLCFSAFVPV